MTVEITLITKNGDNAIMSKHISLRKDGKVRSDGSQCLMANGGATRAPAATAGDFARIISECTSNQAIALGSLKAGIPDPATIVVKRNLRGKAGIIARSREYIDYVPDEPAWALIDFDLKGMPPEIAARIEAAGGMWPALLEVVPGLAKASRVSRASTSAGLYRADTGEKLPGSGGAHHYVLAADGGDIERFLKDLHDWCWLHGFGWNEIGKVGQLLERSLVDRMVGYGERLCFEGAPVIDPPLAQDQARRVPEAFEGETIDTRLVVPLLTEYQRHRVNEAKRQSEQSLSKAAAEVRASHDNDLAEKLSAKTGLPKVTALRLVASRHRGILMPWCELEFDHLGTVLVSAVLADPDRYVDETLADPLEGIDYGRCKAMLMRSETGRLFIHSFAHGRGFYHLRHDAGSAKAAIAKAPKGSVVDFAMAILVTTEMEPDELEDFAEVVTAAAGAKLLAVKARIKKVLKEQREAELKAAMANRIESRVVRSRPAPDGELTPTVMFLDELLAADMREEPPMRDASGKMVEIREREPWNLHLLTSDGTNSTGKDKETMAAPVEPLLVQLNATGAEMLIERYVRWEVETENGFRYCALPRPHVDAFMQHSPSKLPIVRMINTAPMVSMSGNVIDGVGLDRATGLVHRIDPLLSSCVPPGAPSDDEVRDALRFLMEEWLVDVALDPAGKLVAIMLALTLIERGLLPERPAFFITAGQRGGGKTTLANMITLAALGRRASAASWSDNAEERRKALFSYFRQGLSSIAWDNIPRGATITCSYIEAALTSSEISDRVLGVSNVQTVPSTTVQIFTGNNILPRGDMASRSLILPLIVDRPDPENREFVHADPFAWTQANRPKIVRAFYTLLIAGAMNRPEEQEAKTRFKTWWKLVGWPVERAAGLLGIKIDCTELMRAGEVNDEEAAGASSALDALMKVFGDQEFTSRDVVSAMAPEPTLGSSDEGQRAARQIAERLDDALGQLVGKRLDRPTALSIGKLFQKRLVDRPAWIEERCRVATLRRTPGHGENLYRIEVKDNPPGPSENASSTARARLKHSPLSPGDGAGTGKVGKVGKDSGAATADTTKEQDDFRLGLDLV